VCVACANLKCGKCEDEINDGPPSVTYLSLRVGSVALLVARRTNDWKVAGSRPTEVVCRSITVLTGNRMGVNCVLWPAVTPSSEL